MSRWLMTLGVAVLATSCATMPKAPEAQAPAQAAAEISQLESAWATAFNGRDTGFMERVLAPEFTLFSGVLTRRDDWMKVWLGPERLPYEAKVIDVVVAGDTAVATLEASWRKKSLLTDTWSRRNGRWQLVFRHSVGRR
jgi:ketosteroid isomerase-like protein